MSNVKNKKFYWLKLNEDFFERKELRILEQGENGKAIALFYIKLLLIAINNEGKLVLDEGIKFTAEMLADMTFTNREFAKQGMESFFYFGLIKELEDGTFYMTKLGDMVGRETSHASTKRKQREIKEVVSEFDNCEEEVVSEFNNCEEEVIAEFNNCKEEVVAEFNNCKEEVAAKIDNCKEEVAAKIDNCKEEVVELSDINVKKGEVKKTMSTSLVKNDTKKVDNVQQRIEYRDKSIENRDKSLDKKMMKKNKKNKKKNFSSSSSSSSDLKNHPLIDSGGYVSIAKKLEECNFGLPSPNIVNKLLCDREIYGEAWICEAIEMSDEKGVRTYSYVKTILENWKVKGKWGKKSGGNHKKNNGKDFEKLYDFSRFSAGSGEVYDFRDIETEY